MKKSIKISIAGVAFNIEDDAFVTLEAYLDSLKNHFGDTPEAQEVYGDIEERIAELFTDKLGNREIITLDMVNEVEEVLGRPEQIANDQPLNDEPSAKPNSTDIRRRLYRDGDNALIGGVCAGLGAYFNIDPLVFRIIFPILIIAKGLGLFLYLILWIVIPRAKTARQRLEMKGKDINLENLEKNIKHEFEEVKKNIKDKRVADTIERSAGVVGRIFIALGRVVGAILRVVAVIIAVVFISVGLIGLIGTIASFFLGGVITSLVPTHSGLTVNEILSTTVDLGSMLWITVPVFMVVAIPLISLIYIGLRMVFRFRVRTSVFFVTSATLWILSVTILAFVTFLQARSFTILESIRDRVTLVPPLENATTLRLYVDEDEAINGFLPEKTASIEDYTIAYTDGVPRIVGKPQIFLGKSNTDQFEMTIAKRSRGATTQLAKRSADGVTYNFTFVDTRLVFNPYFYLPTDAKWRAQNVDVTIHIPEGKSVYIDYSLEELLSDKQEYCFCWPDEMVGRTWTMKGNRLVAIEK